MAAAGPGKRQAENAAPPPPPGINSDTVELMPLGAGSEVGRSCVKLEYKGKIVLFDCGIHPGIGGEAGLPYFDEVEMDKVDVILVTHFHLDHCAAVPWVVANTSFRGRFLMTHPTKAIYHLILQDFARVQKSANADPLFTDEHLRASMDRIDVVDFHQEVDIGGIKVTPYRAGHVLGACMFMVEIAGMRCLYTGDYSRKADRHLPGADMPPVSPDILIVEATYGVQTHSPKDERERRFMDKILAALGRGGKVLLPIVALGRAQELMLILEDYWEKHPEMQRIPVFQAAGMAKKSLTVYATYVNMLNEELRVAFDASNPFNLKWVRHLSNQHQLDDSGPCVVLATPSMLQAGLSRDLFEAWAPDARNAVIIADFAVQGTLARDILGDAKTAPRRSGHGTIPVNCTVDGISFSAHADYPQTQGFVTELAPRHVMLVHGEATEMGRLCNALKTRAETDGQKLHLYTPRNAQPVHITHKGEKVARVIGRLAEQAPPSDASVSSSAAALAAAAAPLGGVLVRKDFAHTLLHPADLAAYTKLGLGSVRQRQLVPCAAPLERVRFAVEQLFEGVHSVESAEASADAPAASTEAAFSVAGRLRVERAAGRAGHLALSWVGDAVSDMIADATLAVVLQLCGPSKGVEAAEAALAAQQAPGAGASAAEQAAARAGVMRAMLEAQFGPSEWDERSRVLAFGGGEGPEYRFSVEVREPAEGGARVAAADGRLRERVERAMNRIAAAMCPLLVPALTAGTGGESPGALGGDL